MIPIGQQELSVIQGFQALLPCAAQGSPEPRVSWEKDGTAMPKLPGKYTVLRSGELIIERAEVRHRAHLLLSLGHCMLHCKYVLEGLGWLRGSSMGVCEALCDMLACKKGYTNTF